MMFSEFILKKSMSGEHSTGTLISRNDFMDFIHIASNIEITITEEAKLFLQGYVSVLRKLYGHTESAVASIISCLDVNCSIHIIYLRLALILTHEKSVTY